MRLLEDEAGTPLLTRGSRGAALTPPGERFLVRARAVTRQLTLALGELRQAGGEDFGTLRIGVTPILTLTSLGRAFHWFRQRCRPVQVQFIEGVVARVLTRTDVPPTPAGECFRQCLVSAVEAGAALERPAARPA